MEAEPGEGKAHEMKESSAEEVREGSESEEGHYNKTNRKRSAKGVKNTKAPMNGEGCGCGAKKGAKCSCDSGCEYSKKMDAALTPQEYLAACDLGIQGRSRTYIRARLDAAERTDKKCGNSGIPDNAKCNKAGSPAALQAESKPKKKRTKLGVAGILGVAAAVGAAQGAHSAYKNRQENVKGALQKIKNLKHKANSGLVAAVQTAKNLSKDERFQTPEMQRQFVENINLAKKHRSLGRGVVRESLQSLKRVAPPSRARLRGMIRGKRDSVWADGFTERTDKKCGASGIPDNAKCNKGQAPGQVNAQAPIPLEQLNRKWHESDRFMHVSETGGTGRGYTRTRARMAGNALATYGALIGGMNGAAVGYTRGGVTGALLGGAGGAVLGGAGNYALGYGLGAGVGAIEKKRGYRSMRTEKVRRQTYGDSVWAKGIAK